MGDIIGGIFILGFSAGMLTSWALNQRHKRQREHDDYILQCYIDDVLNLLNNHKTN